MHSRRGLRGTLSVPGDKSITHRAVLFGGVAEGVTRIKTSILGRDNFASIRIMRQLGVSIEGEVNSALKKIAVEEGLADFELSADAFCRITVNGHGFQALNEPLTELDCGNSGTTARLLTGVLAGRPFKSRLTGDSSLVKRPFRRVIEPLSKMGVKFSAEKMPFDLEGTQKLKGISYTSPQASAQVKSAIILAGLQTEEGVTVVEPRLSRDHTERMLKAMGCHLESVQLPEGGWQITLPPRRERGNFHGIEIEIPGDFSAAAFFLVAGSIIPGSEICLKHVGFNPSRIGLYHILKNMGAKIEIESRSVIGGEEVVDLRVRSAPLSATTVTEEDVVLAIDEIPILAIAAAVAEGTTRVRGAQELRVKESDRLSTTAAILKSFGIEVTECEDGFDIFGRPELANALASGFVKPSFVDESWRKSGDHRIAMSGAIMDLLLTGDFLVEDVAAVETSFPNFIECLEQARA